MRIIFSRKGFDSSAGGCPSPVVDGRPVSFPIPTNMPSNDRFADLSNEIPTMVADLTLGRIRNETFCHVDPDLDEMIKPRKAGWRGSLGQVSSAAGHLAKNGVGPGDLFLFWGLFRPAERKQRWAFLGAREHRIFGWLQVAEVVWVGTDPGAALQKYAWLQGHPHLELGWNGSNTLYIARKSLRLDGIASGYPGYGVFQKGFRLTQASARLPSTWHVPDWLNPCLGGVGMTYHPLNRWDLNGVLRAASRGQEFIADIGERADAIGWVKQLFEEAL